MKQNFRPVPALLLALIISFTACKKEGTQVNDPSSEVQTHADDQNSVSTDLDEIAIDAEGALESNPSFGGRLQDAQNVTSICGGAAVVDTSANPRTITITYNGNNCAGTHLRTGVVVISMPAGTRWKNAGAAITVSLQNLKIKRLSDNKSITINGSQTFTNVSGGLLLNLATLQTITHTVISNNMSITFDNNSQRTWQVARKRVFTYNNGAVVTVSGIGATGSVTNAAEWGTNRFGNSFITSITDPLVFRQDCNGRLTSGQIKHEGFATSTLTFGLNASGAPTACPGSGAYYYKLIWTGPNGNSISVVLPY